MQSLRTLLKSKGYACYSYMEFCPGYNDKISHLESARNVRHDLDQGKKVVFLDWEHERVLRYFADYQFLGLETILGNHYETNNWAISVPTFGHNDFGKHQINNLEFLIYVNTFNQNFEPKHIDHSNKTRDFLFLNGKPHPHRVFLLKEMQQKKMLSNSLWSASAPGFSWGHMEKTLDPNFEWPEWKLQSVDGYHRTTRQIHFPMYNQSVCSIVSETSCENDFHYITEKTCKPLMAEHVFVILSGKGFLKNLRNLGFRTFNDHFDETYDDCEYLTERVKRILVTLKSIQQMDYRKLYEDTKEIREHNRKLFFNPDFYKEFNERQLQRLEKMFG